MNLLILWFLGLSALAAPAVQTSVELPEVTFVPTGFDDNDNAQVFMHGRFTSTCFRVGPVKKSIHKNKKEITLAHEAYYYPAGWCLFMEVPYLIPVDLGPLTQGNYKVFALDKEHKRKQVGAIEIGTARSASPDEHMYAPVQEARYDHEQKSLTLVGVLPSSCFEISSARVIQKDTRIIEVLPIVTLPAPGTSCPSTEKPFEIKVQIEDQDPSRTESTLIHVRTLNGQSLNQVVTL